MSNRLLGIVGGVDVDPNTIALEPELAQSWEVSEDGLTYTFHLASGVKWQNVAPLDGRDFGAEDVRYAYERYASEASAHRQVFAEAELFEAVDDSTFRITLKRPVVDFVNPLASRWTPIFPRETAEDGSISSTAIGTGPMISTRIEPGGTQVFVKNPDYWERPVLLDGIEFQVLPDLSARLARFRVGQVATGNAIVTTLSEVQNLEGEVEGIQINTIPASPGVGHANFGMSQRNPKFQDERVRRAISLSFDRELMIELLFEGAAVSHPAYPWIFAVDEEPGLDDLGPWVRFDPQEAMKLLQSAGVASLAIDSVYYRYGPTYDKVPEILGQTFADVGITFESHSLDYTEFNSQWTTGNLQEASTSAWGAPGFSANNYYFDQVHSSSPANRWHIDDPKIDEWAEAQQIEQDPDARREILRQMWDYELEVMYRPPLVNGTGFSILAPWVRGLRWGGALGTNSSFYDWGDQIAEVWMDK